MKTAFKILGVLLVIPIVYYILWPIVTTKAKSYDKARQEQTQASKNNLADEKQNPTEKLLPIVLPAGGEWQTFSIAPGCKIHYMVTDEYWNSGMLRFKSSDGVIETGDVPIAECVKVDDAKIVYLRAAKDPSEKIKAIPMTLKWTTNQ